MPETFHSDSVVTDPESPLAVQVPDAELPSGSTYTDTDEFVLDPESDLAVQVQDSAPNPLFERQSLGTPEEQFAAAAKADKPAPAKKASAKKDDKDK